MDTVHKNEQERLTRSLLACFPAGKNLHLSLTDNSSTIVSVRRGPVEYRVRVHRMFVAANQRVIRSLARYVVHNDMHAARLLGEFIERHKDVVKSRPPRHRRLSERTRGEVHDLQEVLDTLRTRYFPEGLDVRITWGPRVPTRGRRTFKVGSYVVEDRLIRVHPALDRPLVPRYFLEWVVFHEMLHAKFGVGWAGGRESYHSQDFLDAERRFHGFEKANAWQCVNLARLMDSGA